MFERGLFGNKNANKYNDDRYGKLVFVFEETMSTLCHDARGACCFRRHRRLCCRFLVHIALVVAVVHKELLGGISVHERGPAGCYLVCICTRRQDMKDLVNSAGDRCRVVL